MNFFEVFFKNFDRRFQNTYFAELVFMTASELYRFIKPIHMQIKFLIEADLLTRRLNRILLIFLDLLYTGG